MRLYLNPKEACVDDEALEAFEKDLEKHYKDDPDLPWFTVLKISEMIDRLRDRIYLCKRLQHNERQGDKNV